MTDSVDYKFKEEEISPNFLVNAGSVITTWVLMVAAFIVINAANYCFEIRFIKKLHD